MHLFERTKNMTDEKKQEFVTRITNANRTELIVILYDMFAEYVDEAAAGYENGAKGNDESKASLDKASEVLDHLKSDLDFSQDKDFCGRLYSIYTYCQELLAKTIYTGSMESAREAEKLIQPLREAFDTISSDDRSGPVMENVPERVAGYTYGKAGVDEADLSNESNRGFLA